MSETMTVEEAAAFLKIHPNTLYKMSARYEVPCRRITNRKWLYIREELIGWLESKRKEQEQEAKNISDGVEKWSSKKEMKTASIIPISQSMVKELELALAPRPKQKQMNMKRD